MFAVVGDDKLTPNTITNEVNHMDEEKITITVGKDHQIVISL